MSQQPLWLRDLVAYSIQAGALVAVGEVMARALRLRVPGVRLAYWHGLLALCLFLPLLQPWRPEVLESSGFVMSNVTFAAPARTAASPTVSLAEIVLVLICAGIALRVVWMALGLGRLWLYRRQAQRIEEAPSAVAEAQRLVPVFPAILISHQLRTPATFGFFRPAILFPARFLEMEPAMQKAIALHELLHVERRDWLWNLLEEAVLTALWFHVPLWWVVRSARLSREQVVDAESVRRSNARRPYLKALLEMAGQKSLAESLPAPLFLREDQLAERVALMMKEVHMSRTRLRVSILTAAGTLLLAGASLVWAFPLRSSAQQAESPKTSSAPAQSDTGKKTDRIPPKVNSAIDPSAQVKKSAPETASQNNEHVKIDQDEIQRQVEQAMKQATGKVNLADLQRQLRQAITQSVKKQSVEMAVQQALDQAELGQQIAGQIQSEIQRQIEQAMEQAKIAPPSAEKLNQADIQRQIKQAVDQAKLVQMAVPKIDQAKIQRQVEQAMEQAKIAPPSAEKLNQADIQRQIKQAVDQAKLVQMAVPKIDQAKIQRQVEQALNQAKIAQQAASKIDQAKIQHQIEQALKQAQIGRLGAEKAREKMKETKPLPPTPPKPVPASPKVVTPPPTPPAPPAPPSPPQNE